MELDVRYSSHPEDARHLTTGQLRERFLIDTLFVDDRATLVYSHFDRIIAGGIKPVRGPVALEAGKELGTKSFLERRELGIINVGGPGTVRVGADTFALASRDGLYVGMGQELVNFASDSADVPAKFYLNSAPAHKAWPTLEALWWPPLTASRWLWTRSPRSALHPGPSAAMPDLWATMR